MPDRASDIALNQLEIPSSSWDRRASVRRADDRTLRQKCMTLARETGYLLGIAVALIGVVVWFGTLLGVTLNGPPQAIATLSRQQDSLTQRVTRLELGQQSTRDQLHDLTGNVQFLSYMLCTRDGGGDPVTVKLCQQVVQAMQSRESRRLP